MALQAVRRKGEHEMNEENCDPAVDTSYTGQIATLRAELSTATARATAAEADAKRYQFLSAFHPDWEVRQKTDEGWCRYWEADLDVMVDAALTREGA